MKFEWNSKKNEINIRECGVDFADAKEMFEHGLFAMPNTRKITAKIDSLELDTYEIGLWW